jgi:hypothetical protein
MTGRTAIHGRPMGGIIVLRLITYNYFNRAYYTNGGTDERHEAICRQERGASAASSG